MGWEARIGGSGCTWRSCTLPPYPAQVFTLLGVHEFLPSMELLSKWQGRLCKLEPTLCVNILAALCQHLAAVAGCVRGGGLADAWRVRRIFRVKGFNPGNPEP